jgi:tRNA G18 (ribose-2'-O)-methylase SpoU
MADQAPAGEPSSSSAPPACFLIVYGVAKKHNIGTLLRCATAFGVKQVGFAAVACLS